MNDYRKELCIFLTILLFSSTPYAQDVNIPSQGEMYAITSVNVDPMYEELVLKDQTLDLQD